jgi:hypothetical protein
VLTYLPWDRHTTGGDQHRVDVGGAASADLDIISFVQMTKTEEDLPGLRR